MTERDQSTSDGNWHLDKRVPIAMILAIAMQTGGWIWWASATAQRLDHVEREVQRQMTAAPPQADRLTRVEVKLEAVQDGITEIKRLIQVRPPALQ